MFVRFPIKVGLALSFAACIIVGALHSARAAEDKFHNAPTIVHQGDGLFSVSASATDDVVRTDVDTTQIDLKQVEHGYDPAVDDDVPIYTNVTLNDVVPPLFDESGREYGYITLYQIDPPLADLPSREPDIDRGIDMRSPTDMVKSAYSNYVSPVFTDDLERRPVSSHPIGHFYVKVQVGGYPTILTGMTTIRRADQELVDFTLGRQLGLGGVLLTPEPGRLNSASEAFNELLLRQRRLRVIDGLYYEESDGKNIGPEYIVEDGNVVFARFRVPAMNGKDAINTFVEFLWRGQHRIFGSLISRPHKGTGAGCTPFAMMWLKASGVIPFVTEPNEARPASDTSPGPWGSRDFWHYLYRSVEIPWDQLGCDERVGTAATVPASYTVYDNLFHGESTTHLRRAIPGLAEKIRRDQGVVSATLFSFGALTPLRDLIIAMKRNDPDDLGDYEWSRDGDGLTVRFWDNGRFSDWIKHVWSTEELPEKINRSMEGRFLGIELDLMDTPRQQEEFFAVSETLHHLAESINADAARPITCRDTFAQRPND